MFRSGIMDLFLNWSKLAKLRKWSASLFQFFWSPCTLQVPITGLNLRSVDPVTFEISQFKYLLVQWVNQEIYEYI